MTRNIERAEIEELMQSLGASLDVRDDPEGFDVVITYPDRSTRIYPLDSFAELVVFCRGYLAALERLRAGV